MTDSNVKRSGSPLVHVTGNEGENSSKDESTKKEEEAKKKEDDAKKRENETRKSEDEAKKKEHEAKKDAEANKKEEAKKNKEIENSNIFRVETKNGKDVYTCLKCGKVYKVIRGVRNHFDIKHRNKMTKPTEDKKNKRALSSDSENDEEDAKKPKKTTQEPFDEKFLERYDDSEYETDSDAEDEDEDLEPPNYEGMSQDISSQQTQEPMVVNQEAERVVIDLATGQLGTLEEAIQRINMLEEENKTKEELIKKLELEAETKNDLWNIAASEANNLKSKLVDKDSKIQKYQDNFRRMKADIDRLKEKKANSEEAKKLKKTKDELKLATKNLEETIKIKENLNVRLGQEVSARAHAEKEVVRLTQCQSALQLIAEKGNSNQIGNSTTKQTGTFNGKKPTGIKCKDFNKLNGCSYGDRCKFDHIKEGGLEVKKDCSHWMEGECNFTDKACKYSHDPTKKGIKMKANSAFFHQGNQPQIPAQGLENQSTQDQVNFYVKMMTQQGNSNLTFPTCQMVGNSEMGANSNSAQGMDVQRQTFQPHPTFQLSGNSGMGAHSQSAQGLDGQRQAFPMPQAQWITQQQQPNMFLMVRQALQQQGRL